jgi:4-diphosphocytidyl-2-C-methyl-D-erythritol kinase
VKIRAPAKINLSLRVVGRRADGYHLLDTVIVPVSLYDEIELRRARRPSGRQFPFNDELIQVRCDHPSVPQDKTNLVYRAAALIMKKHRKAQPVWIRIKKNIPVGAGLGGGSSDAAATLLGLNRLLKLRLSTSQLEKMALALGTDVPFFIRSKPARARGIGEKLRQIPDLPYFWCVIVYPGFPVSTAWVYRKLGEKLTKSSVNTSIATSPKSFDELARRLQNDLEDVTFKRYPKIAALKRKLLRGGAPGVLMSGSGSSVFGIFASKKASLDVFCRVRQEEGAQAFLVHVLN